jgi:hypothetical protein
MQDKKTFYFLQGDGEMATLTRNFNWESTSVGPPGTWPEALCNTVAMILQSRFPMFLWWENDMIQFYNDAYRPSLGNTGKHPAALGQKARDCWPEIWDIIYPLIHQVQTTGIATWNEDMLVPIYRNGAIEDVYWTFGYSPIRITTGEIKGVLVVCTETTEKVLALQKITASENNIRMLIMQSPVAMGLFRGVDMVVEIINEPFLKLWGKDSSVRGKPLLTALPELESQPYLQIMRDVLKSGITYNGNEAEIFLEHEGQLRQGYFNFINAPYVDEKNVIQGIIVVATEVTEEVRSHRRIEQMLREMAASEANFRNLILKAPVAMCLMTGPDHVIEIANEMIISLWGKAAKAVMNRPVFEALPDARGQGLEELLARVYNTGETYKGTEQPVQLIRNGVTEIIYQNFVYQAYQDPEGKISGVIAITLDVTPQVQARRRIEELVASRTDELKRSNEELAQFAYIASHDLQEPVRKVLTYTDMLRNHLPEIDDLSQSLFDKVTRSSMRMHTLIRDVLTYSELSKANQNFITTDLNTIVDDVTSDFELVIEQKKARIEMNRLPVIDGVPLQMSQLFGNLISNALKFVAAGVQPMIIIKAKQLNASEVADMKMHQKVNWFKIELIDNGVGYDGERAQNLFKIFQRLHTRKEFDGTGIGLALCKKIVENHRGTIQAHSSPGTGSVFTIFLPQNQFA